MNVFQKKKSDVLPSTHVTKVTVIWLTAISLIAFFAAAAAAAGKNQMQSFAPGAYIVNMGQEPQTIGNGLKPYGLIYQLIVVEDIPVCWAINSSKSKDGDDFSADGKTYKGGSFIIDAERISPDVIEKITVWKSKGVAIDGPVSNAFSAPVYKELTSWPRAILDAQNDKLVTPFYANAEVPTASYITAGNPTMLTHCGDVYVLPHADPQDWTAASGYADSLMAFIKNDGYLYASCHAVSALESISGCNFLSNGGLVLWSDHEKGTPPYTCSPSSAGDPIMQFLGALDASTENGSEEIYLPKAAGWRNTTTIAVYDPDNPDVPGLSPGPAAIVAYGRAFGTQGMVVVNAGHALDQGTEVSRVAAQRAYFNFLLMAGVQKQVLISDVPFPITLTPGATYTLSAKVSSGVGPYSYKWSCGCGGTFSDSTSNPTTFTAPNAYTTCVIRVTVTDACGRVNFASKVYTGNGIQTTTVRITSAITRDRNSNGFIDQIEVTFDTSLTINSGNNKIFSIIYGGVKFPIDSIVRVQNTNQYRLYLQEQSTADPQTAWRPTISISGWPGITPIANYLTTDGCPPVIWRVVKKVDGDDRRNDSVYVYMSEKTVQSGGASFNLANIPDQTIIIWNFDHTTKVDTMLTGIPGFARNINDSILVFTMSNGRNLTASNWANIRTGYQIQDRNGNITPEENHLVRVIVDGMTVRVNTFPNPSGPTVIRVADYSNLQLIHHPNARKWVSTDHAGIVITISNITPPDRGGKVKGMLKIYDIAGNSVNWMVSDDIFGSADMSGRTSMDIYWNGLNNKGMKVASGVYRAVLYLDYPASAMTKDIKVILKLGVSN
jgi:hypothetical protein